MTAPLDEAAIRARHQAFYPTMRGVQDECRLDGQAWPCDAIQALDALAEVESRAREVLRTGEETERALVEAKRERDDLSYENTSLKNGAVDDEVARSVLVASAVAVNRQWQERVADLEADLAAMRGALERIKREAGCGISGDSVSVAEETLHMLDRIEDWAGAALASSPGAAPTRADDPNAAAPHASWVATKNAAVLVPAAWLATAREMVGALGQITSDVEEVAHLPELQVGERRTWKAVAAQLRALLARPEVQGWAGR